MKIQQLTFILGKHLDGTMQASVLLSGLDNWRCGQQGAVRAEVDRPLLHMESAEQLPCSCAQRGIGSVRLVLLSVW